MSLTFEWDEQKVVVYTEREPNICIISCRRATQRERGAYEDYDF